MQKFTKRFFSFFGDHISRKHGQKCCPYGQNGKPLSQAKVEEYLGTFGKEGWRANDDFTKLRKSFYLENIFCAVEFVKDLYDIDATTTRQIPNLHIENQDIVRVELYTPLLKGLSYRDLELATIISQMDFNKYKLIPIQDEQKYRQELRAYRLKQQTEQMDEEIARTAGGRRFDNKFKATDFEQNFPQSK